jgi:hemerythrin-like metal-binding protein
LYALFPKLKNNLIFFGMNKIIWEEKMSVGIQIIDIQHKTLIDSINEFYNAIGGSSHNDLTHKLLKKMKEYSIFHFNSEEALLKKHAYPEFDGHKKEHQNFISKIDDIDKRVKSGQMVLSLELTSFIKSWLTNHILVIDKKYSAYLKSKGVV